MTSTILLTGGTGTLGRHLTPLLSASGAQIRILSRHTHKPHHDLQFVTGNLLTGDGVDAAVGGADIIVHLAGGPKGDDRATQNLVQAAIRSGYIQHLVYISVIGADRVPLGYFRAKFAAEQAVAQSGLPFTTLRAAQFHDLVLTVAQKMAKLPVVPVPSELRFQPVDSREVATRLADITAGSPAGQVADLPGPRIYSIRELVHSYLQARHHHRLMMPLHMPGKAGRSYRAGENLNLHPTSVGRYTWEEFLAERINP